MSTVIRAILDRRQAREAAVCQIIMTALVMPCPGEGHHFLGRLARHHRHDLNHSAEASPLENPLLKEPEVVALHELKAAAEVGLDPAVVVPEALDHHEEHDSTPGSEVCASVIRCCG